MTVNEQQFYKSINRYFNYGYVSRAGKLMAMVHPALAYSLESKNILNLFLNLEMPVRASVKTGIQLQFYSESNQSLVNLGQYLRNHIGTHIKHAVLHGSYATGEAIPYSDTDILLIVNNSVFTNRNTLAKVGLHLNKLYRMMIDIDPLQHHGVLVLPESSLNNWPCSIFPPEIFSYSCSFKGFDQNLNLFHNQKGNYQKSDLLNHLNRLSKLLFENRFPGNAYEIKSLLSEFMLLPSLYIQTKSDKGVYKKESFQLAASDFDSNIWQVMNDVSALRELWPVYSNAPILKNHQWVTPRLRKIQKSNHFEISPIIGPRLNSDLIMRMRNFILQMKSKLE